MACTFSSPPSSSSNSSRPLTDYAVQQYKDSIKAKAEELKKIAQINLILETPQFKNKDFIDVYQDLNIPMPNATPLELPPARRRRSSIEDRANVSTPSLDLIPLNRHLVGIIEIIKPRIRKFVEDSNLFKMWIIFMIPKIEDGNNFGVEIQEDILAEIKSAETEGRAVLQHIWTCFRDRGKLISKVIEYPHLIDYRRAVQEFDEHEFLVLCSLMVGIRNRYCTMHDIILKNLEKITKPRSTDTVETLY